MEGLEERMSGTVQFWVFFLDIQYFLLTMDSTLLCWCILMTENISYHV